RVLLAEDRHGASARHHLLEQLDAAGASDVERQQGEREQYRAPRRQDSDLAAIARIQLRNLDLCFVFLLVVVLIVRHRRAPSWVSTLDQTELESSTRISVSRTAG